MPPDITMLSDAEIELIENWIADGAPGLTESTSRPVSSHWAFQSPRQPPEPPVRQQAWVRNTVDRFVLVRLEKEGLRPSPEADKITLLRRVCLDLTGISPTPQEVDAFVTDTRPDAYERQVEKLLASPHYGERWGRHG
jgi:hypothetical protein